MLQLFLLICGLLALGFLLLGVRVLLGKRFVHTHVDGSKALEQKGIHCAQSQDAVICRPRRTAVQEKHHE